MRVAEIEKHMAVPGGRAFVKQFVEDACRWTQFVNEPMFIIQTEWHTLSMMDIYRSMGIQWATNKWKITSAPIKVITENF